MKQIKTQLPPTPQNLHFKTTTSFPPHPQQNQPQNPKIVSIQTIFRTFACLKNLTIKIIL